MAFWPFSQIWTSAPALRKTKAISRWLSGPSSARRIRQLSRRHRGRWPVRPGGDPRHGLGRLIHQGDAIQRAGRDRQREDAALAGRAAGGDVAAAAIAARRLLIASPRPVPPNFRVVEASACWNGWKRSSRCCGLIPTPVSITSHWSLGSAVSRSTNRTRDLDLAGFRELDGIAHEVDEDLPQSRGIGLNGLRDGTDVLQVQGQALGLGPHPHQRDHVAEDGQGRDGQAFDLQLAGLDLGEIEDVVDQAQEVVAVAFDGLRWPLAVRAG